MKYRKLGKQGIKVSELALGAWLTYGGTVESAAAREVIHAALAAGVNFLDIADIYARGRAEEVVGEAIRGKTRSDLVVSSKVFWPMSDNVNDRGLSRKHIMESIHKSLKRIGTDYLDIYFCHRFDPDTEVDEVVRAMDDLGRQGKVLYWGTSVWTPAQIERVVGEACALGACLPAVEQPRYNMLDRHIEPEILPICRHYGMGLTVWSPLAQGLLTGKYNDGRPEGSRAAVSRWLDNDLTETNFGKVRKLAALARELDLSVAQLALAWILRLPEVSCAIIGATGVAQLEENLKAVDVTLEPAVLDRIEFILTNQPPAPEHV